MDNMAYLNQISASNRPAKSPGLFPFPFQLNKTVILLGLAAIAAIVIMLVGTLSGGSGSAKERDLVDQIQLRSDNLVKTISTYNPKVKSSELRSMGSSLSGVLTETSKNMSTVIAEDFNAKEKVSTKIANTEAAHAEEINNVLETARLNGLLDRNYVRQLTLEIALLMSLESECSARTNKENLKSALSSSYTSLENLHSEFSAYSDSTT